MDKKISAGAQQVGLNQCSHDHLTSGSGDLRCEHWELSEVTEDHQANEAELPAAKTLIVH